MKTGIKKPIISPIPPTSRAIPTIILNREMCHLLNSSFILSEKKERRT